MRLFLNILTPDENYSLSVKASVEREHFKSNYLQIQKYLLNFFLHFRNLHKIWNTLKENMNVGSDLFLKL